MEVRSWSRLTLRKAAACLIGEERLAVVLCDLSPGGCMIELARGRLVPGDRVSIDLIGLALPKGHVTWRDARGAGVEFDAPVHEAVVLHLGFTPARHDKSEDQERDKFGRTLPPLDAGERR